jgi:hypothetical protein
MQAPASTPTPPSLNRGRPMFVMGPVEDTLTARRHPGVPAAPVEGRKEAGGCSIASTSTCKDATPMDVCTLESLDEFDSPRCVLESLPSPPPSPTRDQLSPVMSPKKSPYSAELRTHFAPYRPYIRETRPLSLRQRSKSYAVLPQDNQGGLRRSQSYSAVNRPLPPLPRPAVCPLLAYLSSNSILQVVFAQGVCLRWHQRKDAVATSKWSCQMRCSCPP